jgi:PKD repeat protein
MQIRKGSTILLMKGFIVFCFLFLSYFVKGQHFVDFKYENHCLNNIIYFSDSVVLGKNDSIITINWDFGDGFSSYDKSPIHAFDREGEYEVTMNIQTLKGNQFGLTKIIQINTPPLAYFFPQEICKDEISFKNETIDSAKHKAIWDFGDGSYSMETSPVHKYANAGNYKVSLKVMNELGCWDSTSKHIEINELGHIVAPKFKVEISENELIKVQQYMQDSLSSPMTFEEFITNDRNSRYRIKECGDTLSISYSTIDELIKKVGTENGFAQRIKRLELRQKDGKLIYKLVGSIDAGFYKQWTVLMSNAKPDDTYLYLVEYDSNNQLSVVQSGVIIR